MPEDRDGPKKPNLSREFENETRQPVWHDREFRMYSDETLEQWRKKLTEERDRPAANFKLTIGGGQEQTTHSEQAAEREKMIRRIDAELMYRLMTSLAREGRDPGDDRER